ncbi:hypothetical protein BKA62DRAFT_759974 [Auriculariales sp. MPI-PUGE-AT-0066]|nr:hypothetical protein BKA62DRAFT_759974 [Auriculariales sp. MPI-PUGE-AT-0066]
MEGSGEHWLGDVAYGLRERVPTEQQASPQKGASDIYLRITSQVTSPWRIAIGHHRNRQHRRREFAPALQNPQEQSRKLADYSSESAASRSLKGCPTFPGHRFQEFFAYKTIGQLQILGTPDGHCLVRLNRDRTEATLNDRIKGDQSVAALLSWMPEMGIKSTGLSGDLVIILSVQVRELAMRNIVLSLVLAVATAIAVVNGDEIAGEATVDNTAMATVTFRWPPFTFTTLRSFPTLNPTHTATAPRTPPFTFTTTFGPFPGTPDITTPTFPTPTIHMPPLHTATHCHLTITFSGVLHCA